MYRVTIYFFGKGITSTPMTLEEVFEFMSIASKNGQKEFEIVACD